MLICAMFDTRLSPAWCGMYAGVLTVALPVVGFSAGVALAHGRFPRLPWANATTGQGLGGRGFSGKGRAAVVFSSCFNGNATAGVQQCRTTTMLC